MKTYSGQLGLVLLPEAKLRAASIALAKEIPSNEIDLGGRHEPHLTLYHSKLEGVTEEKIQLLLNQIKNMLPLNAQCERIAPFGGKFTFWDTIKTPELERAHEKALELSEFYNRVGTQQAQREGLNLSPQEVENVRQYGHPLVRSLWRPHITIGYQRAVSVEERSLSQFGRFSGVAFVEVGEYGTLKQKLFEL